MTKLTVRLISGLGNNLYQIATVYHLSKQHKLDWSVIHPQKDGKIQEIRMYGGHYTPQTTRTGLQIPTDLKDIFPNVHWEYTMDPSDTPICSYIFSYLAFYESIHDLKQILTINPIIENYIDDEYKIDFTRTIGIHLRFTSGADSFAPEANDISWIDAILNNNDQLYDNIVVISNRTSVAREFIKNLSGTHDKTIILIENEPNIVDFCILKRCNIIICSNSTFSFWSAALSNAIKKYICSGYTPANEKESIPHDFIITSDN